MGRGGGGGEEGGREGGGRGGGGGKAGPGLSIPNWKDGEPMHSPRIEGPGLAQPGTKPGHPLPRWGQVQSGRIVPDWASGRAPTPTPAHLSACGWR